MCHDANLQYVPLCVCVAGNCESALLNAWPVPGIGVQYEREPVIIKKNNRYVICEEDKETVSW